MKRNGFILGLLILVALWSVGANAADPANVKEKKDAIYNGLVVENDPKAQTLTVAKENSELGMLFNISKATFSSDYKGIADVKVGDQVTVKFEVKLGTTYALEIAKEKAVVEKSR